MVGTGWSSPTIPCPCHTALMIPSRSTACFMASRTRLSSNGFWFDAIVTGWNDGLLTSTTETAGVPLERRR